MDARQDVSRGLIFNFMAKIAAVKWLDRPEAHDYPAAISYLSLLYSGPKAQQLARALKSAPIIKFKAKDIFRASGLPRLDAVNSHVQKDVNIIRAGGSL